jgi:hypothetical protein
LEQHCKLTLNTKLEIVFISNHRIARELLEEPESRSTIENIANDVLGRNVDVVLRYSSVEKQSKDEIVKEILDGICEQPGGVGLGCALKYCISKGLCKIIINTDIEIVLSDKHPAIYEALTEMEKNEIITLHEWLEEPKEREIIRDVARNIIGREVGVVLRYPNKDTNIEGIQQILTTNQNANLNSTVDNISIENQATEASKESKEIPWRGFRFRSQSEVRIAQQLDRRKVLFFPNCKARLGFRERENREPDFLVCYEGKWGILEVDGEDSHPHGRAAEDHERDRLFKQHGILLVEHFDAGECWENADGVVKKFLELLRKQR